jgi:hypothetical protein
MSKDDFVPRTRYEKLQRENNKLMADIRVMDCGECFEAIQKRIEWRAKFKVIDLVKKDLKEN